MLEDIFSYYMSVYVVQISDYFRLVKDFKNTIKSHNDPAQDEEGNTMTFRALQEKMITQTFNMMERYGETMALDFEDKVRLKIPLRVAYFDDLVLDRL